MASWRFHETTEPAAAHQRERPGRTGRLFKVRVFAKRMSLQDGKYVYQHLGELDKNHRQNEDPFASSGGGRLYENTEKPRIISS